MNDLVKSQTTESPVNILRAVRFSLFHLLLFEKASETTIMNELLNNIVEEAKKAINNEGFDEDLKSQLIMCILENETTPASIRDRLLKDLEDSFKKSNTKGFTFVLKKLFGSPNVKIPPMIRDLINSTAKDVTKILGNLFQKNSCPA